VSEIKALRVRVSPYDLVSEAVASGCTYGINRYYKYFDGERPPEHELARMAECLADAVMSEICEVLHFPALDDYDDEG